MTSKILLELLPVPERSETTPGPAAGEEDLAGLDKLLATAGLTVTTFIVICAVAGVVLVAVLLLCIWCCCRIKAKRNEVQMVESQPMQIQSKATRQKSVRSGSAH